MSKSRVYPIPQYTATAAPIEVVVHTPQCTSKKYTNPRKVSNSFYKRVEAIAESKFALNITEYVGDVMQAFIECDTTILPSTVKDLSNTVTTQVSTPPPRFDCELSMAELGMSTLSRAQPLKSHVTPRPSPVKSCTFDLV